LTTVSPQLEALKKEGEAGRKTLNQYTRYLTVILAAFQSYGIAVGLEGRRQCRQRSRPVLPPVDRDHADRRHHVPDVARRADHLARHRQRYFADHSLRHRRGTALGARRMLELGRQGALSTGLILVVIVMAVAVIAFIRVHGAAQRRLLIQYPKRQVGNKMFEGQSSHLPLKLNTSGVIPPIFASSLLLLPTTVANFNAGKGPDGFSGSPRSSATAARCSCFSIWR